MVVRFLIASSFVLAACHSPKVGNTGYPLVVYPEGPRLLLAAGNDGAGRLDLLAIGGPALTLTPVLPIHSDATVRSFASVGKTVVINRFGQDSLYVLGKGRNTILAQTGLKKGANPQDVLFRGDELWVSQRGESELLRWNVVTNTKTAISLAELAFTEGGAPAIPDMMMLTTVGPDVWVTVQRLKDRIVPSESSLIAMVRPSGEVRTFPLLATNPVTAFKRDRQGNLYVGTAGHLGSIAANDGGIELLNVAGERSERMVITEQTLGGDLIDFEILDENRGVALISKPSTKLVQFNVATGLVERQLMGTDGYDLVRLHLDRQRNRLYLSDRRKAQPAIQEFSVDELKLVRTIPLELPVWEMEIEEP